MSKFSSMIIKFLLALILSGCFGSIAFSRDNVVDVNNKSVQSNGFVNLDELVGVSSSCDADQADQNNQLVDQKSTQKRKKLLSSIDERLINSCLITHSDVQRRLRAKNVELIDIRSKKEFEEYRVPGSINLSSFEVKSKAFLKSKHLVILGNSLDLIEMGALCKDLKQHGFKKVNIMKDGLMPWKDKLIGDKAKAIDNWEFGKISPKEFLTLQSKIKWLVLDAREKPIDVHQSIKEIYAGLEVIPFKSDKKASLERISEFVSAQEINSLYGFLVVTDEGASYEMISEYLGQNNVNNVFYMDGGIKSYSKYLITRQAFLARLKKGPMKNMSCGGA